ncbi:MAG TPA: PaaI family thioesterase [Jatrophihabitantaceae bacterium]|nr:PaaI family thioesterase [Jatrophihabitantaceae bacterium]
MQLSAETSWLGGFAEANGFTMPEATGDRVVLQWEVTEAHHQPYGIVHGGVYCAAVESAGSIAGALWFGDRGKVVGVNNSTDFLRAVNSGRLTATATPIHRGRSQQLWQVAITDEQERLVARGQVRLQNLTT